MCAWPTSSATEVARAYADVITGIKIRSSAQHVGRGSERTREALRRARRVADAIGKPLMVHSGNTAISVDEVLAGRGTWRGR